MSENKNDGEKKKPVSLPDAKRDEYNGHEIVFPIDERRKRISIDGRSVYFGVTAGGEYFLDKYAYDRAKSLEEVIKRYLDHLDRVAEARREDR